tara:strand:- start:164 stop:448 length:285 start_codon:yes stop_codon:yes gene_type:complete
MNRKLVLYTYSSDWQIDKYGGVANGANPNMPHNFVVKESHNMVKFMPGDEFEIERLDYPQGLYDECQKRGYTVDDIHSQDKFEFVLVNPKGAKA